MQTRILVVDDDADFRAATCEVLKQAGYEVVTCGDGRLATQVFEDSRPQLVILDVIMPGLDGYNICSAIRRVSTVPIIFVSARGTPADKAIGLRSGADDYIAKPFNLDEFLARLEAVLRRSNGMHGGMAPSGTMLRFPPLVIDLQGRKAEVDGKPLPLTPIEFRFLAHVAQAPGKTFTREELLEAVWRPGIESNSRTVDVHVRRVRKKLEEARLPATWLSTVRGAGYGFQLDGGLTGRHR